MGLDTSHDCWHGGYGSFAVWRECVAKAAGVPLLLMEGFYGGDPSVAAMEFLRPREGGPHGGYDGVCAHMWIEKVAPWLPIPWDALRPDPIHVLLNHSDCDGEIAAEHCGPLADRLEALIPDIGDGLGNWPKEVWRDKARQFVTGLRLAASRGEHVEFH